MSFFVAVLLASLAACSSDNRKVLIVYSPHGKELLEYFEKQFEKAHPDIDVQWVDMGSQEVLERVRAEKPNPQADVWFGAPAEAFDRATKEGLLQPYKPTWAAAIDPEGRDANDNWYGTYLTPEVIGYNRDALKPEDAPKDWDDLIDPKWRGKILIRDPIASGTMRAVWGMIIERSIRQNGDTGAGFAWLRRLDGQTKEYVLNGPLLDQKIVRQEGLITIWDLPDIQLNAREGLPLGYVFPKSGTPVIEDAIGVIRRAPHEAAARAFVEWVGTPAVQLLAAREVYRLPARTDLPVDSLPAWARDVRAHMVEADMDWDLLTRQGPQWMRYWDEHVRGKGGR